MELVAAFAAFALLVAGWVAAGRRREVDWSASDQSQTAA